MKVWRAAAATAMPWRNGGGSTREYACHPDHAGPGADTSADTWDWRLSVAEVAADGPFSEFPGVDRILVLLSGEGMDLTLDGAPVALHQPLAHVRFPGEAAVHASLVDGPTTDLNLMWRRDRWNVTLARYDGPGRADADMVLAFVAAGQARLPDGTAVGAGDAFGREGALLWAGDPTVMVFALTRVTSAPAG